MQLEQPKPLTAAVGGAITSEYATKYNTKGDKSVINATVVRLASLFQSDRSDDSKKTGVLTRCLNALNKTLSYPLVMTAFYNLGFGDSWFPLRTTPLDTRAFQRDLQRNVIVYADPNQDYMLVAGEENDLTGKNNVAALSAVTLYRCVIESCKRSYFTKH
jgi:hypothetical protein